MSVPVAAGSHLHVITPGDHFSPDTGSAVPTVVHGLAAATPPGHPRTRVAVAHGTYRDHYPSADVVGYDAAPGRRGDRLLDGAAAVLGLPRPGARRSLRPTVRDQGSWAPSVVVAHNAPQLARLVDTRRHASVVWFHNELLRTYASRAAGNTLAPAAALVCVSDFLAERTAARLPVTLHGRVATVPNGVDTTFFSPDGHEPGEVLSIVFVGRMVREKGPDLLLDALARLGRADLRATLVGTPHFAPDAPLSPYERGLRRLAAPLGDRVTWLPFRPREQVAAILRAADVVVVPSRWDEPFALTVLEGMASGAAVVAADVGGIPEAAGDAGLLVPPTGPSFADALGALADDRGLLAARRAAAREHAVAHDWAVSRRRFDTELARLGITARDVGAAHRGVNR
ncbi:glycosyltransferase family 4 protein [Isoptericola variabilis]|uniref:glycosyltransferase family 4 protein n=1 Tax=Isoptericola variabilis TaxID=139208 RepID=UPI003D1F9C8B